MSRILRNSAEIAGVSRVMADARARRSAQDAGAAKGQMLSLKARILEITEDTEASAEERLYAIKQLVK